MSRALDAEAAAAVACANAAVGVVARDHGLAGVVALALCATRELAAAARAQHGEVHTGVLAAWSDAIVATNELGVWAGPNSSVS